MKTVLPTDPIPSFNKWMEYIKNTLNSILIKKQ